jgi:ribosomal protein S18 acetylase RimI-like enzyme
VDPGRGPGGLIVRRANASDYPTFVRLFPELQVDDPVPERAAWEVGLAPWTWIAELPDGAHRGPSALGYLYCQEYLDTGYVRHVVVDREARRAGVGRTLMRFVADALRASGKRRWCLNVKPANVAALRLYEGLGLEVAYPAVVVRLPRTALAVLGATSAPDAADGPVARLLAPERFALVEAGFGLPRGQLDAAARQGRVLVEAISGPVDDAPVGLAAFDLSFPSFPRAFPLRLRDGRALAVLLQALRAHALSSFDHVQLVLELVCSDERAAVDRLMAVGAAERDRVLHLEGRL